MKEIEPFLMIALEEYPFAMNSIMNVPILLSSEGKLNFFEKSFCGASLNSCFYSSEAISPSKLISVLNDFMFFM